MSDERKTEAPRSDNILYLSQNWKSGAGPKPVIFDFAEDFIIFLVLLPVILLPLRIINPTAAGYLSIAIVPADFALLTLNRCRAKRKIYFILILLPITAAAVAASLFFWNFAAAIAALFAAPVSCMKLNEAIERNEINLERHSRDISSSYLSGNILYAGGVTCFLAYFGALFFGYKDIAVFSFADYAAVFASVLIYRHSNGAYCLSQWNKTAKSFGGAGYGENSRNVNGAVFSVLAVAAGGILSAFVYFSAEITGASRIDLAAIGLLKSAREPQEFDGQNVGAQQPSTDMIDIKKALDRYDTQQSLPFAEILGKILEIFFTLLAVFVLTFAVVAIIRAVFRYVKGLGRSINEESRSLLTADDAAEKLKEQILHMRERLDIFARGGKRMKIRRLFYNHVKRHRAGIIVKSSDCPFEIGAKISGQSGRDLSLAAKIYEKARYSNDECDENDVRLMKEALK